MSEDQKISNELIYKKLQLMQQRLDHIDSAKNILFDRLSALNYHMTGVLQTLAIHSNQLLDRRGRDEALENAGSEDLTP